MQTSPIQQTLAGLAVVQKWLERTAKSKSIPPVDRAVAGKHARDMRAYLASLKALDTTYRGWANEETYTVYMWLRKDADRWTEEAEEELRKAPTNPKCIGRKPVWTVEVCAMIMLARRMEAFAGQFTGSGIAASLTTTALGRIDWLSVAASFLE